MECGGLPPLWELGRRRSRAFNGMQWRRIEGGAPGFRAGGKQLGAGNGGPSGGTIQRSTEGEWTFRGARERKQGRGRGAAEASCREVSCPLRRIGQFWAPARKVCWVWRPSDVASAGGCYARTVAPPRGPKTEMRRRCASWAPPRIGGAWPGVGSPMVSGGPRGRNG